MRRFSWLQFSLRSLLVVLFGVGGLTAWICLEFRNEDMRRLAFRQIEEDVYTCDFPNFAWYKSWLHRLRGQKQSFDPSFLMLQNEAAVNDAKLAAISNFSQLEVLALNGQITATDAGLAHLKKLKNLRELYLSGGFFFPKTDFSPAAVEDLRRFLPDCKITWEQPGMNERSVE